MELASRGIALTAPPTDLRGTVSQDVAYQVAQDDWRTTEQKAARVDAVPITGSALAQVDIAGQPDGSCLCWVFVLGVEPPLQGPMQSFVDPSRTWFMSFVDARTGDWWGAKAVVHYLPEIEDMIKRGEAVRPTAAVRLDGRRGHAVTVALQTVWEVFPRCNEHRGSCSGL